MHKFTATAIFFLFRRVLALARYKIASRFSARAAPRPHLPYRIPPSLHPHGIFAALQFSREQCAKPRNSSPATHHSTSPLPSPVFVPFPTPNAPRSNSPPLYALQISVPAVSNSTGRGGDRLPVNVSAIVFPMYYEMQVQGIDLTADGVWIPMYRFLKLKQ